MNTSKNRLLQKKRDRKQLRSRVSLPDCSRYQRRLQLWSVNLFLYALQHKDTSSTRSRKTVNQLHLVLFSAVMNHPHSHAHAAHLPSPSSLRTSCAPQQLHTPWKTCVWDNMLSILSSSIVVMASPFSYFSCYNFVTARS